MHNFEFKILNNILKKLLKFNILKILIETNLTTSYMILFIFVY